MAEPANPERSRGDWVRDEALFAVLVVAASLSPIALPLTDNLLHIDFFGLHLVVAIYLGFRMGRWYGLTAGLLALLPWLIWPPEVLLYPFENLEFLEELYISSRHVTWNDAVFAASWGWLAGFAFDAVERFCLDRDIGLAGYFPRRRSAALLVVSNKVPRLFKNWGRKAADIAAETEEKRTLDSLVANVRSLWTRINQLAIVPIVLSALSVFVVIPLHEWDTESLEFFLDLRLLPLGLVALLIVVIGYVTASRMAVLITILVWIIPMILVFGEFPVWEFLFEMSSRFSLTMEDLSAVVGTAVLAWIAARFGRIHKDGELADRVARAAAPYRSAARQPPVATLTVLMPVLLLCIAGEATVTPDFPAPPPPAVESATMDAPQAAAGDDQEARLEDIVVVARGPVTPPPELTYNVWTLAFVVLLYLGARFDARGISNRAVIVIGLPVFLNASLYVGDWLVLRSYAPTASDFLLLVAAPLVGGRLDFRRVEVCRAVLFAGWFGAALFNLFTNGFVGVGLLWIAPWEIASLALQVAAVEGLARALAASVRATVPQA